MARVRKVELSFGRAIKTGQYETFRAQVTMGYELELGEYTEELFEQLADAVYKKLQRQIKRASPQIETSGDGGYGG